MVIDTSLVFAFGFFCGMIFSAVYLFCDGNWNWKLETGIALGFGLGICMELTMGEI